MWRQPKIPTADDVATAVVTAARLTGEDPLAITTGKDLQCRHYAMHALHAVFPEFSTGRLGALVGALGKPAFAYRSSLWYVLGQAPQEAARHHRADWWNEQHFAKVVEAVRAPYVALQAQADAEHLDKLNAKIADTDPDPEPQPLPKPVPARRPRQVVVVEDRPSIHGSGRFRGVTFDQPELGVRPSEKRSLQDELRAAVERTAAMTPPPDD